MVLKANSNGSANMQKVGQKKMDHNLYSLNLAKAQRGR
uniref:Uncharacterized protein n=1 Tax=Tetranychus urticae TaxID=32264 RepID=T1JYU8_TETUR